MILPEDAEFLKTLGVKRSMDKNTEQFIAMYSVQDKPFLEHFGRKGMKWGTRTTSIATGSKQSIKSARVETRAITKDARSAMKASRKASTPEQKKAAADKYEKDVVNKIQDPKFRETYNRASSVGKGEMAAHLFAFGPVGIITIAAVKNMRENPKNQDIRVAQERATATEILKQLRS